MRVYEGTRELRIACKHDDLLPSLSEYDPRRESCETVCHPAVFCFADVDAAKEFIRFIGWQMLTDSQIIDIDCDDVIKAFASQRGNILCISKKNLFPQEKLSAQDAEVQGALLIFRGDEQLSMLEVCGQAEELSRSFHESADIIWMIEMCPERSVTALLAKRLID